MRHSEKPITFTAWSMQRILAGEKTATLRPMKPQPVLDDIGIDCYEWKPDKLARIRWRIGEQPVLAYKFCRYQPGDILWPREPWHTAIEYDHIAPRNLPAEPGIFYHADDHSTRHCKIAMGLFGRKMPGRSLPKRFARPNRYEVLRVEVRRPQGLTIEEIIAEGIEEHTDITGHSRAVWYASVWEGIWSGIYGEASWKANPWCWRLTFRGVIW